MFRRAVVAALLAAGVGSGVQAQGAYPSRPIRLIVPAVAGGVTDIAARVLAQKMGAQLGQTIVVENKAGGGGRIGPVEVARAPADGYTLLYANAIGHALIPATSKVVQYDPLKDFTPVALVYWYTTVLVCHPSVPYNTVAELIDYAKQHPNKVTMASAGQGSGSHFQSEWFNTLAGVDILHVPYRGAALALQDVVAGVSDCTHDGSARQYIEAGKVKALATAGRVRDPRFQNIPTLDEVGLKGYDMTWWQGIVAPANTPQDVLDKLNAAVRTALNDPEVMRRTYDVGLNTKYGSPAELRKAVTDDMAKFRKIANAAKIVLD